MGTLAETRDIQCGTDMTLEGYEVSGVRALAERLLRRLTTPKGMFEKWWPNEGYDCRDALLSKQPLWKIRNSIESECERDEQCISATAEVQLSLDGRSMIITLTVETEQGDYDLTMGITQAAGTLISIQKSTN